MIITKTMWLDVTKKYTEPINFVQYEKDSRVLDIYLSAGGLPVNVTGASVVFYARKPDKTLLFNNCDVIDSVTGHIQYIATGQTSTADGELRCWILIIKDGAELRSLEFMILVEPSEDDSDAIESTSEFTALEVALSDVGEVKAGITALGAAVGVLQDIINDPETGIDELNSRMGTAENGIASLGTRMTAAETVAHGQAYRTAALAITNVATWYSIPLNAGHSNLVNADHSLTVNPERVTVLVDGDYEITVSILFKHTGATSAAIRVIKNGTTEIQGSAANGVNTAPDAGQLLSNTFQCSLSANEYITLQFSGSNAGGTTLTNAGYYGIGTVTIPVAMLSIKKIGPKT